MEDASQEQQNKPVPVAQPTQIRGAAGNVVVASIIFGLLGGLLGGFISSQGKEQAVMDASKQVSVTEDSNIINVVKKDSSAVVSIVISKDLSKIPGYGFDQNNQDPFYNFFYRQNPAPSTQPDIQEVGAGSGFFVSSDGLILTNRHVVEDTQASYSVITQDGKHYDAQVMARDPVDDLAIVKISISNAPSLELANSSSLQVGQRVIAIGNSLGQYQNTVTSGIVSGIGRTLVAGGTASGSEDLENAIQTDAAINPGNSGGPLLNVLGQVIGINTAIDEQGQLVGFALPANLASQALASFKKNNRIVRPFLGVRYVMITPAIAEQEKLAKDYGALVVAGDNGQSAVLPGGPADKGGIMENDIILAINGTKIDQSNRLSQQLGSFNAGDIITITLFRAGQQKDVKVTLAEAKPQS